MLSLLFYRAKYGNIQDKLISLVTCGPFSHVELKFSDGVCFSSSLRDGGTRFKKIAINPKHWAEIELLTWEDEYSVKEKRIRTWCEAKQGLQYNLAGVLGLDKVCVLKNRNKWFCSELCLSAITLGEVRVSITPNDLFDCFSFYNYF